jgi:hypothetical protein
VDGIRYLGASLLCGAVLFGVGITFHGVVPLVAPGLEAEYRNAALFRPWGGWTRPYVMAHPWLYGFLFAGGFFGLRALVGAQHLGGPRDGLLYGLALFVAGSGPIYALNYASFQVAAAVIASWALQSVCQYAAAGLALGWFCARGGRP